MTYLPWSKSSVKEISVSNQTEMRRCRDSAGTAGRQTARRNRRLGGQLRSSSAVLIFSE